jgi:cellulose biosynthesis protein BcsQ
MTTAGSGSCLQRITNINVKGGCGKTTVATNLASAYARLKMNTVLMDFDPQSSSLYWLKTGPSQAAKLHGIAAYPRLHYLQSRQAQHAFISIAQKISAGPGYTCSCTVARNTELRNRLR